MKSDIAKVVRKNVLEFENILIDLKHQKDHVSFNFLTLCSSRSSSPTKKENNPTLSLMPPTYLVCRLRLLWRLSKKSPEEMSIIHGRTLTHSWGCIGYWLIIIARLGCSLPAPLFLTNVQYNQTLGRFCGMGFCQCRLIHHWSPRVPTSNKYSHRSEWWAVDVTSTRGVDPEVYGSWVSI
jgi:hypothetical protein